mmetsp:Transcript_18627/g.50930  ORF Transcript_18627/g.50930 Transcript_18627/m.50930 type:complete len:1216 (+) Transcript_18627:171-3818(+)|eukprot:CAMPEP_0168757038 /NCGR_PEP_ID=MMETSP0724-20121128/20947_1 /TAXON_ID=265536 /ORGANISM="Amphiprora sp., Strain CCMP467" /LENGTH=1215 /DNA_ID=CAMNT_0008805809 /DNA_START=114 /DNA_END=3761 /DNA_ORIENTATION=-
MSVDNQAGGFGNFDAAADAFGSFVKRERHTSFEDFFANSKDNLTESTKGSTGTGNTDTDSASRKSDHHQPNETKNTNMPAWGVQSMSAFDAAALASAPTPEFDPFSHSSSNLDYRDHIAGSAALSGNSNSNNNSHNNSNSSGMLAFVKKNTKLSVMGSSSTTATDINITNSSSGLAASARTKVIAQQAAQRSKMLRRSSLTDSFVDDEFDTMKPTKKNLHKTKLHRGGSASGSGNGVQMVDQKEEVESMFEAAFSDEEDDSDENDKDDDDEQSLDFAAAAAELAKLDQHLNPNKNDDDGDEESLDMADDIFSRDGETEVTGSSASHHQPQSRGGRRRSTATTGSAQSNNSNSNNKISRARSNSSDDDDEDDDAEESDNDERRKAALRQKHFKSNFPSASSSQAITPSPKSSFDLGATEDHHFDPFGVADSGMNLFEANNNNTNINQAPVKSFHQSIGPEGFSMDFMVSNNKSSNSSSNNSNNNTAAAANKLSSGGSKWVMDNSSSNNNNSQRGRSVSRGNLARTRSGSISQRGRTLGAMRLSGEVLAEMSQAAAARNKRRPGRSMSVSRRSEERTTPRPTQGASDDLFQVITTSATTAPSASSSSSTHDRSVSELRPSQHREPARQHDSSNRSASEMRSGRRDRTTSPSRRRRQQSMESIDNEDNGARHTSSRRNNRTSTTEGRHRSRLKRNEGDLEPPQPRDETTTTITAEGGRRRRHRDRADGERKSRGSADDVYEQQRDGQQEREKERSERRSKSTDDVTGGSRDKSTRRRHRSSSNPTDDYKTKSRSRAERSNRRAENAGDEENRSGRGLRSTDAEASGDDNVRDASSGRRRRSKSNPVDSTEGGDALRAKPRRPRSKEDGHSEKVKIDHDEARRLITEMKDKKSKRASSPRDKRSSSPRRSSKKESADLGNDAAALLAKMKERRARREKGEKVEDESSPIISSKSDAATLLAEMKERRARRDKGETTDETGGGGGRSRDRREGRSHDESRRERRSHRPEKSRTGEPTTPTSIGSDRSGMGSPSGVRSSRTARSGSRDLDIPQSPKSPGHVENGVAPATSPFLDKLSELSPKRIPRRYKGLIAKSGVAEISENDLNRIDLKSIVKEAGNDQEGVGDDNGSADRQFIESIVQKVMDVSKNLQTQSSNDSDERPSKSSRRLSNEEKARYRTSRSRDSSTMKSRDDGEGRTSNRTKSRSGSPSKHAKRPTNEGG